ncbi:MAG TPA: hypothetical protein VGR14_06780 [Verrucomicrobiae bacterium]|jgi:hypothetical protein|nr:hypothetical protein [Verrucomicrobiae bacterium]
MKFIELPSGLIINLDQVAYAHREEGNFKVCFSAGASTPHGPEVLHLVLDKRDTESFIRVLKLAGMNPQG